MKKTNIDNGGCLVLIGIIGLIILFVKTCGDEKHSNVGTLEKIKTVQAEKTSNLYQNQNDNYDKEDVIDEDDQFIANSLSTGSTPYSSYYGKNYKCPYDQCSSIRVTAPAESDLVVIIKRNNQNGKVISHGYIRSGESYQFDIPDGTYQTFFYYGEGWNPTKDMGNGIKGGFIKDEVFSKDNPQDIFSGILTYVLQLQRDGNFQTKGSNLDEVF